MSAIYDPHNGQDTYARLWTAKTLLAGSMKTEYGSAAACDWCLNISEQYLNFYAPEKQEFADFLLSTALQTLKHPYTYEGEDSFGESWDPDTRFLLKKEMKGQPWQSIWKPAGETSFEDTLRVAESVIAAIRKKHEGAKANAEAASTPCPCEEILVDRSLESDALRSAMYFGLGVATAATAATAATWWLTRSNQAD